MYLWPQGSPLLGITPWSLQLIPSHHSKDLTLVKTPSLSSMEGCAMSISQCLLYLCPDPFQHKSSPPREASSICKDLAFYQFSGEQSGCSCSWIFSRSIYKVWILCLSRKTWLLTRFSLQPKPSSSFSTLHNPWWLVLRGKVFLLSGHW